MKKVIILAAICNLQFAICNLSFAQQSELENGVSFYKKRAEGASGLVAKPENIDHAIKHFTSALQTKEAEEEAAVYLMKCYYFKGTFVETDNAKRLAVYELSRVLGEKMTAKYPTAPVIYWYMSNLAKWGEASGIMKAAKEGLADKLKELCEKVIALNPKYRSGAGYRMLGIIHYKTPYIPLLLSWPSNEEAIANLEKCLAMDPNDLMANLYLGQVLYDEGNEDRAIEVLQKVADSKPGAIEFLEDSKDIKEAKELLVKYKK